MKALVTGATGIVGSNLVRALLDDGHQVRVLLRPSSDSIALRRLPIERWSGDVLENPSLVGVADGCDFVFHAAAIFAYSGYARDELDEIAVQGTRNVLTAAADAHVKRVVVTSSTVVLGSSTAPDVRNELSQLDDTYQSSYTLSKLHQEQAALEIARELKLDVVFVCPGLTVGPNDYRLSPSNGAIVNYLNDPMRSTFRTNLHWRDVHRMISEHCGTFGPVLTLNNTATYMAAAIAETAARMMGKRPSVTRDEATMACRFYWYSSDAIMQLGYRQTPPEETLAEALAWLIHRAYLYESVLDQLEPDPRVLTHLQLLSKGST